MEERDYDLISKMADNAFNKAMLAKKNSEDFKRWAERAAEGKDEARAAHFRKIAASYLNDYFHWIGHAKAYKGIAAGLALGGVVEREIDSEPTCP